MQKINLPLRSSLLGVLYEPDLVVVHAQSCLTQKKEGFGFYQDKLIPVIAQSEVHRDINRS